MGKLKKIKDISAIPTLKILAKTKNEKGELFEKLMKTILDNLGYTEFRTKIHKTGAEIDIEAKHKVTRESIICECKAHNEMIKANDLKKFFGQLNKEKARKKRLVGLFFSLSEFSGTALGWYEELDDKAKEYFILYNDKKVLKLLREAKIIKSDDLIEHEIKDRIPYGLGIRYLTYSKYNFNWVQSILSDNQPKFYVIVSSEGEIISKMICKDLEKLDKNLKGKHLINLQVREKVLLNLLDMKEKTMEQVAQEVGESEEDIILAIENLCKDDLLKKKRNSTYYIDNEFHNFITLSKTFLTKERGSFFIASNFCRININKNLIDHIEKRLNVHFPEDFSTIIERAIKISPSTLRYCLFGSVEQYLQGIEQIKKDKLGENVLKFWTNISTQTFMDNIIKSITYDLEENEIDNLLDIYSIQGYYIEKDIRIASKEGMYMQVKVGQPILRLPVKSGTYEKGMLLSPMEIESHINEAVILSNLDLDNQAIEFYNQVIENTKNEDARSKALNNKGVTLMKLGRFKEAIGCFEEALKVNQNFKEAWSNKGLAHIYLEEFPEAEQSIKKTIEIDSSYPNSYIYMAFLENKRGNRELVFENLAKAIDISSDFKRAVRNDKNFENLWDDSTFKEITGL